MATVLNKDLVRESTEEREERNILVTLTKDQEINLRLKGQRNDGHSIEIGALYDMISGSAPVDPKSKASGSVMISLHDLRSHSLISTLDYDTKVKFEQIILSVLSHM